jgi:predicted transcriptional regulator
MIDYFEQINYDDLTPDIRLIADVCGIEAVREILRNLNGLQFYIPKVTSFERFVYRYINENNHKTIKEIARELDVTEYYLKSVIKRNIQV